MKLSIENNRIFVNDKEITGWKKIVLLPLIYLVIACLIITALWIVFTLLGIALSLVVPICIAIIFIAGIIYIIKKLLKRW